MKDNQKINILKHLERGQSLTALNALNLYGTLRLAARIHELREAGYAIKSEKVPLRGSKKHVALYWI
jgi:Helix-turn-helix domain